MSSTPAVIGVEDSEPAYRPPRSNEHDAAWRRAGFFAVAIPIVAYLVLILLGATTSSIGISSLRQDPEHPLGMHIGGYQSIRSDEFGTGSPLWLGQIARDGASAKPPLSVPGDLFAQLPSGPISDVVFFESSAFHLAPVVPAEMLFAMKWWLPTLLLFIGLPIWFRQISGRLRWGYLAAVLIAASPATVWWSGLPINTLGFVSAGCALAVFGSRAVAAHRWIPGLSAFLIAGILLARTPTYYQPTAIVIALPIVAATALVILTDPARLRMRMASLAMVTFSAVVWTAALFWESRDAIAAGLSTVYPGLRQSSGTALDPGFVFGATNLGWLRFQTVGAGSNQSEITTSYVSLGAALVILLLVGRLAGGWRMRGIILTIAVPAAFWTSWALVSWGAWSAAIPVINRVPAARGAMGAGYLAVIGFCLALSQLRSTSTRRLATALAAGGSVSALSAWAGSALHSTGLLLQLEPWMVALSALAAGAVVFALVYWPGRAWPMIAAGAAAIVVTATAQPLTFGLGDLRASSTAHQLLEWGATSRADGTLWASDSPSMDSLMAATAVPSLSYRQQIGPDRAAWGRLDPSGTHQVMWNRGGTHIGFDWTDSGVEFSQPYADTVVVHASPCAVQKRIPRLRHLISTHPLKASCLVEVGRLPWSGRTQYVYRIVPTF